MKQRDLLLDLFHRHNNKLTLGEIMQEIELRCEYRRLICEIRASKKYSIEVKLNHKTPSQNLYTLTKIEQPQYHFSGGQGILPV